MKKNTLLVMLFLLGITFQSFAQPGALDLSFNKTGQQSFTLKTNGSNDFITTTLLQPDGKLLVAGSYYGYSGQIGFISRLNTTGEMDPTFGNSGRVRFQDFETEGVYMSDFIPQSIALQSTGNIVLAGHYGGDGYQPALANLLPDGSLNKQFNSNGYKTINEESDEEFSPSASLQTVQVHPSTDNIIAGGYTSFLGDFSYMLTVALDKYGVPFAYEDNKEYMLHQISGLSSNITCSVRFHADSMYLGVNQNNDGLSIAGVTALSMVTGQYNEKFGDQYDVLLVNMGGYEKGICNAITLTTNKDIILAGYGTDGDDPYNAVVHKVFASSESEDFLFGTNGSGGKAFQFEASSSGQEINAIAVDPNNNIIAGGYYADGFNEHYWAVARLNASGQLNGFDGDGLVTFPLKNNSGIASIHAVSNGYLLAGTHVVNSDPFESDGIVKKIDNTGNAAAYGNASEALVWAKDHFASAEGMTLYNGRLWVSGNVYNTSTPQNGGVAVINATTGAMDASFGGKNGAAPGAFLLPSSSSYPNMWIRDLRFQGNQLIVAATYFNSVTDADELLLMRFNLAGNSLQLDTEFGEEGYAISTINAGGIHQVQGLLVQENGKIIVYGYFGESSIIGVLGFTADGDVDTFAGTGSYVILDTLATDPGERKTMDGKILFNGNLAFTLGASGPVSSDILLFILSPNGTLISSEFYDLFEQSNDAGCALAEKADHSLFIGGYANGAYAVLSLNTNGAADTNFDGDGRWLTPSRDTYDERIVGLYVNGQSLVAVGRAEGEGGEIITAMRLTLKGRNDSTFIGKGYVVIDEDSKVKSSLLANNRLYIAGHVEEDAADMLYGDVYKIVLGTGPMIKETNLTLTREVKTLGQEPFTMRKTTNSPAPVTYKIISGTDKATIHPTTGLVTLLHSTYETSPVVVVATQPSMPGYSAASAEATITINRGIPTIVFTNQGGVVNQDTLKLSYRSNSQGYHYFSSVNSSYVYEFYGEDYVIIKAEGEARVGLSFYSSQDYEEGYAEATIFGYTVNIPPVANNDEAQLVFGQETKLTFNVLSNDEAFTGSIVTSAVDLDPNSQGIQSVYVSPALGLFEVDTATGDITYTPFSGFIGSGKITYTITDTKNKTSAPANILVSVILQGTAPALKATELFTPNNDGLNDAFVIGNTVIGKENQLIIFDRNGQQLFTKDNYNNDWYGELSNGKTAENGIYYYIFTERSSEQSRELKGVVELRR